MCLFNKRSLNNDSWPGIRLDAEKSTRKTSEDTNFQVPPQISRDRLSHLFPSLDHKQGCSIHLDIPSA